MTRTTTGLPPPLQTSTSYFLPTEVGRTMFTLPALLYLKLLRLFGQCLYHLILLYPINPVLHMLVERLSPRWSSTGLAPFLGRPGQCGYFYATPTGGRLAITYDLARNRPHTRRIFSGIGF
ncbi:hypothetical protein AVEN_154928-1 [Araneus ventricosus]|uniref:Uncharacterized protein n=1 Tax=Araneus ventricosus TaxID=182803 RepID=A0A4Y2A9K9_ARAVE|nr:hypothetical protein AVEN_154928-1 [Araneus ventricosus]